MITLYYVRQTFKSIQRARPLSQTQKFWINLRVISSDNESIIGQHAPILSCKNVVYLDSTIILN